MSRRPPSEQGAAEAASVLDRLEARVEALLAERERFEAQLRARDAEVTRLRDDLSRFGRERQELRARLDALVAEVDAAVLAVAGA